MPGAIAGRRPVLQVAGCQGFVGGRTRERRGDGRGRRGGSRLEMTVTAPPPEPPRAAAPRSRRAAPRARRRSRGPAAAGARRAARSRWSPRAASMLLALLVIGALRWMSLLEPAEPFRAWEAVGIAVVGGAALVAAGRLAGPLRPSPRGSSSWPCSPSACWPAGWPTSTCGPTTGARSRPASAAASRRCPASTSPTRARTSGRASCLAAGGTALVAGATALALWPRRDGRLGFPLPALVLLVALAVVPAVVLAFEGEFVLGAVAQPARARLPAAGEAAPARRARRRGARGRGAPSWRSCSPPPWTAASRGGTTRTGRCPPPPRARRRSPGTTTTRRSSGRATAASSCASRPASPRTGRPRTSTPSRAAAGSRRAWGGPRARCELPARPGRGRALEPGHPGDRPQPPHADLRRGRRGVRRRATCPRTRTRPRPAPACSRPRGRSRAATRTARRSTRRGPRTASCGSRAPAGTRGSRTTVACSSTRTRRRPRTCGRTR